MMGAPYKLLGVILIIIIIVQPEIIDKISVQRILTLLLANIFFILGEVLDIAKSIRNIENK